MATFSSQALIPILPEHHRPAGGFGGCKVVKLSVAPDLPLACRVTPTASVCSHHIKREVDRMLWKTRSWVKNLGELQPIFLRADVLLSALYVLEAITKAGMI